MRLQDKLIAIAASAMIFIVISSAIASLAVYLIIEAAEARTPVDQKFECCGLFEGGLVLLVIWLAIFGAICLVMVVATSIYKKQKIRKD